MNGAISKPTPEFLAAVERHAPAVYAYARTLCGPARAGDVAVETFTLLGVRLAASGPLDDERFERLTGECARAAATPHFDSVAARGGDPGLLVAAAEAAFAGALPDPLPMEVGDRVLAALVDVPAGAQPGLPQVPLAPAVPSESGAALPLRRPARRKVVRAVIALLALVGMGVVGVKVASADEASGATWMPAGATPRAAATCMRVSESDSLARRVRACDE